MKANLDQNVCQYAVCGQKVGRQNALRAVPLLKVGRLEPSHWDTFRRHWSWATALPPLPVDTEYSALGVFQVMRYINVRYLLTYLPKYWLHATACGALFWLNVRWRTRSHSPHTGHTSWSDAPMDVCRLNRCLLNFCRHPVSHGASWAWAIRSERIRRGGGALADPGGLIKILKY